MKKVLKITGISVAVIFLMLLILPFVFKGKIVEQVKIAINENVNAVVDFDSFSLSFIRNFPNVSLRMKSLTVVGVEPFAGDTLASVRSFSVSVNLMSLFGSDGYEIKNVTIDQPNLLLKVLKDGTVNWDITVTSDAVEDTLTDEEPIDFKIALRKLQVKNADIVYDDAELDLLARIRNMNHTLRGDFTADFTTLQIRNTTIESLFVTFEGISYLYNVFVDFTADIDADLNEFLFTFRENTLIMNGLLAEFEGTFAMPEDAMIMDFVFASPQNEFKAFLSMIPAIYAKDFEGLRTSGTLELNGHVKGVFDDNNIPGFGLNVKVENGTFQYPDLPAAITDVFINTSINNPGGDADYTIVDVSRFNLNVAGNPVDMKLNLRTPVSDPNIDAMLKGRLDLGMVKDFYPLDEGETLQGIISTDMVAKGRMSSIENERYSEFLFEGQFTMNDFGYKSNDFPQGMEITEMNMRFSPQFVQLSSFRSKMGDSDLSASGRIDNLLGFALSDQLLTGNFNTQSSFFNLNQFMEEEPTETPDEPIELSVIEIPGNVDFTLRSNFDKMLFGDLEITNINGVIRVVDQTARLQNLRMNMLDGTMVLNGSYSSQDIKRPSVDFDLNISQFDIQKTFNTFNTFQTIAPIGKRAHGRFSASFGLKALLDEKLEPVLSSLAGDGSLQSSAIRIENSPALVGLAENLRMNMFRELDVRDINVSFEFKDGRVEVKPFDMNFGNSTATIQGYHGFDQSINYVMSMAIPRTEFGGAANDALNALVNQAAGGGINITPGATINVGAAITGTVSEPRISLSLAQTAGDLKDQVMDVLKDAVQERTQEVREQVQDVIDDGKERVSEELERRAQQVISEAERQAENIRREAANAATTIREEARANAKRLEDEASGPIAKAAARRTGEQLIRTADEQANRLENEADTNANNLVNTARQRADRIRAGQE
jgi:hypothetical protein